jgi:leucyl-tRNA synthetase
LPNDPDWIIEPIADSTFYPAYFVVRRFVAGGQLPPSGLTDAFFDRVFLGLGPGEPSVSAALQDEIAAEFRYWYPLDLNIGGKEHKRVHFPVFLYTHVKLLPPELLPKGIFVHWWLTEKGGGKVSKKKVGTKGGSIPSLEVSLDRWGADALRLFYTLAASPQQDVEWEPALVDAASDRLADLDRLVREGLVEGGGGPPALDAWLEGRAHRLVSEARLAMERLAIREFAEKVYVEAPSTVRRYLARGGAPGPGLDRYLSALIRLLQPVTPHLSEELYQGRHDGLAAEAPFPDPEGFAASPGAEAAESFLENVEEDLRSVLKPAQERGERPSAVAFFVAAPWKRIAERWMREAAERSSSGPPPIREMAERARGHAEMAAHLPELAGYVAKVFPAVRSERTEAPVVDESAILRSAEGYLSRRYGFERIDIVREEEGAAHDPKGRRERARPGRPAFYLTGGRVARAP